MLIAMVVLPAAHAAQHPMLRCLAPQLGPVPSHGTPNTTAPDELTLGRCQSISDHKCLTFHGDHPRYIADRGSHDQRDAIDLRLATCLPLTGRTAGHLERPSLPARAAQPKVICNDHLVDGNLTVNPHESLQGLGAPPRGGTPKRTLIPPSPSIGSPPMNGRLLRVEGQPPHGDMASGIFSEHGRAGANGTRTENCTASPADTYQQTSTAHLRECGPATATSGQGRTEQCEFSNMTIRTRFHPYYVTKLRHITQLVIFS